MDIKRGFLGSRSQPHPERVSWSIFRCRDYRGLWNLANCSLSEAGPHIGVGTGRKGEDLGSFDMVAFPDDARPLVHRLFYCRVLLLYFVARGTCIAPPEPEAPPDQSGWMIFPCGKIFNILATNISSRKIRIISLFKRVCR